MIAATHNLARASLRGSAGVLSRSWPAQSGRRHAFEGLRRHSMMDVDRPLRSQDPLDQNVRSGVEGSGVGTWDLELSTRQLNWSNDHPKALRRLAGSACRLRPVPFPARSAGSRSHGEGRAEDRSRPAAISMFSTGCTGIRMPATGYARSAPSSTGRRRRALPGSAAS